MNLRSLIRPSATRWAEARTQAEVAQVAFEQGHPEPYDSEQHSVAVSQRAAQSLHHRGYRLRAE